LGGVRGTGKTSKGGVGWKYDDGGFLKCLTIRKYNGQNRSRRGGFWGRGDVGDFWSSRQKGSMTEAAGGNGFIPFRPVKNTRSEGLGEEMTIGTGEIDFPTEG